MRNNRITIDIIDNGYLVYEYIWNDEKGQWEESNIRCAQDKLLLDEIVNEYIFKYSRV